MDGESDMMHLEDAGKQRKIHFLMHSLGAVSIVYYLYGMTGYYMHQRPREKWSEELTALMESNAPFEVYAPIKCTLAFEQHM